MSTTRGASAYQIDHLGPVDPPDDALTLDLGPRAVTGQLGIIWAAFTVGMVALSRQDQNDIGAYGLIQVLPPIYYPTVLAVVATLLWALRSRVQPTAVMTSGIIALVVLIHGSAAIIEDQARFATGWLHAGFTNSIMSLGHATPYFDARMSWPGFFTAAGTIVGNGGLGTDVVPLLRWAPAILFLCYTPLLLSIGRATLPGWRAPWLGVIVFVFANWVGQDYFAPQTVAFIMYLAVLAVLLSYMRKKPPGPLSGWLDRRTTSLRRPLGWIRSLRLAADRSREPAELGYDRRLQVMILSAVGVLILAIVAGHQLTPVVLGAVLFALWIVGRLRPWPLTAFTLVATMSWLCYAAQPFWSGHFDDIFGSLGSISATVDSGVTSRLVGSPEHLLILKIRVLFVLLVWGLAGLGALRMWLSGKRLDVLLIVLMCAPTFLIVAQSYGGEGLLRVFYFSLPGSALLITGLVFPRPRAAVPRALVATGVALGLALPVLLMARWGNETFERDDSTDLAVIEWFYNNAPLGSTILTLAQGGPYGYQDLTLYTTKTLPSEHQVTNVSTVNQALGANNVGSFVVITRPQVAYLEQNASFPADYGQKIADMLLASGEYRLMFRNSSGWVLRKIQPTPVAPLPSQGGRS